MAISGTDYIITPNGHMLLVIFQPAELKILATEGCKTYLNNLSDMKLTIIY